MNTNAKHAYRVKYRGDLQGINPKELTTMTPTITETSAERLKRQAAGLPHPKVIAAQEQFARVLKTRRRRNTS